MFGALCFTNTVSSFINLRYPGNLLVLKCMSVNLRYPGNLLVLKCMFKNVWTFIINSKKKYHNPILFQATQPVKKVSSGTKRKASLMDKSCKDHTAKKQKMAEAKPSTASSKPAKKPGVKWIKW